LLRNADVKGVLWGGYTRRDPEGKRRAMEHLLNLWQQGKLAPRISAEYPFEEAGQAIADLAARKIAGKAVVRMT
jgi:NADPH:quinone reductase-like Zn-dependent oxidoreductase